MRSTGYEVTFTAANGTNGAGQPTANGVPEGMPDATEVIAQFGGSLTINAGTSQVLTYDPVGNTGARQVDLVGGTRYLANASPGWAAGSTVVYTTSWMGTLQVNPGTTTGGVFAISRSGGNTYIGPNAALQILAGAVVNLQGNVSGGTTALTGNEPGYMNSVAVSNSGTLNVQTSGYQVGNLNTNGLLILAAASTLTASNLNVSGGSLNYTLGTGAGASGFLNVSAGSVGLPAAIGSVTLNLYGSGLSTGTYALMSYGSLSGTPSAAFTIGNKPIAGDSYSVVNNPGIDLIDLIIAPGMINGIWKTNGGGTWGTSGNWSGGVPGSGQDTAVFGAALTSGTATVTLDASRSLSSIGFSTSGGASYTISPSTASTSLTLANPTTGTATISDSGGNHTIAANVVLGSNLSVAATTGSALTISGAISQEAGGSDSLSFSGSGELILSGTDAYSGGTTVSGGTLEIAAPSALAGSGLVTIAAGGRLVLGAGAGIGSLLAASSPLDSGAVALASAAVPATLDGYESASEDMAALGGAAALPPGGAGSAAGGSAAAVPEPAAAALLAAATAALAVAAWRRKRNARG